MTPYMWGKDVHDAWRDRGRTFSHEPVTKIAGKHYRGVDFKYVQSPYSPAEEVARIIGTNRDAVFGPNSL